MIATAPEAIEIYEKNKSMPRTLSCDFVFVPDLSGDKGKDAALALLISSVEIPVLDQDQGRISIAETTSRHAAKMVRAMRDAGTFEATMYEGLMGRHHGARKMQCTFVRVEPCVRSWVAKSVTTVVVHLDMKVIEEIPGNIEPRQA